MKFVERGVDGGDEEGNDEDSVTSQLALTESAAKKCGENSVLREVAAFADHKLDGGDGCIRNIGSEPAEERTDESRGVLG